MKKRFIIPFTILCALSFGGCQQKTYQLPWDHFCHSVKGSYTVELEEKERKYVADLLNGAAWEDAVTNCACDYIFYFQIPEVQYHSECGTFNDVTNQKHTVISAQERETLNGMLRGNDKVEK